MQRTQHRFWLSLLLGSLAASGGAGCSSTGGQTGDETEPCREVSTPLTLNQRSPLGFSAQDVLALTLGEHRAALDWRSLGGRVYGPEVDIGQVTVTVSAAGAARFIDSEIAPNSRGLLTPLCVDRVAVDVHASALSAGGALDERFACELTSSLAGSAEFSQSIEPAQFGGRFAFEPASLAGATVERLFVRASFGRATEPEGERAFSGVFEALLVTHSASLTSATFVPVASWPAGGAATGDPSGSAP